MPDALERGLLFGVLAVRENLVDRAALLEAMNVWIGDGTRCLEQIIRQRHRLTDEQLLLLDRKVAQVLDRTEVDPRPLLTEVGPGAVRGDSLPTEPENGLAKPWDGGRTLEGDDPGGHDATLAPGSSSPPVLSAVAPGSPGVRYRILELLARGGLGEVYVARDEELDRLVALKLMQDRWANDPVSRDRFLLEAGITSALEHPGIVPVHGLGLLSDGRPYYTMKLVKGEPLKDAILEFHRKYDGAQAPGERMPELRRLLRRFLDVCHVIDYAHSRKILHRDLKPANILLGEYAETLVVDWGLAKDLERGTRVVPAWTASPAGKGPADATLGGETVIRIEPTISDHPSGSGIDHSTLPGSTLGTPNYMSPEQAAGWTDKIGPASDIYGLGATLYFLLAGVPPCDGPDLSTILTKVRAGEITPPRQLCAWVPETLAAICLKALAGKPEDRYESPHALAGDIEHWLADEPVAIHRDPVSVRLTRWGRRHRSLAVAVGVLLVSAVFGLTLGTLLLGRANLRVLESARTLERQLYIHRVNLAHRECIEGNISHAERLLSLCPDPARDWEWYYVARLCHRERFRFRGHRECVNSVAFTRDGTGVLSGAGRPFYKANRDDEAELILWESATGRELRRFEGLKGSVHGVAISPDGKWVASASGFYDKAPEGEGRLRVWDAVTGAVVLERTEPFLNALTVAFSPDGRHVAVGFGLYSDNNFPGHFMVFEVTTGQVVLDQKIRGSGVNTLAFHPDCKRLAVGGTGAIELWDIAKKEKLHDLPGHESWVYSVAFHPDGLHLISGGWDRTVRIWDLSTRKEVQHIAAHAGIVLGVAVDRDGKWVASCGDDNVIKLWDAATGRALTTLRGHASQIPGILGLAFSPDGKTLASAGGDRAVMLWDVTPDEQVTFHDQKGWITSLLCLPDNRTVVSGSGDHSIALWDADTGRLVRKLGSHLGWVLCLALSPDGKLLASGGADSVIRLWDLAAGKEIKVLNGSRSFVRGLAFSPDGKFLVSAGGDQSQGPTRGEVNLWDLAAGKLERILLEESRSCNSLAFSPDGQFLAVAVNSREGPDPVPSKVVILDWPSGRMLRSLVDTADPAHDAADFPSGLTVVFSPDDGRLAVDGGGGAVKLYDPSTGKLERTLRGHTTQMGSLAFSPGGRRLISSNFDRLIKVWDTSTGEELLSLRGHDGGVVSLAFSPDGHRLLSGGVEHTARVWDARPLERELNISDAAHD